MSLHRLTTFVAAEARPRPSPPAASLLMMVGGCGSSGGVEVCVSGGEEGEAGRRWSEWIVEAQRSRALGLTAKP
jgi:hypothetical protein